MTKLIELSDRTYAELSALMGPDDTTDSFVRRLMESRRENETPAKGGLSSKAISESRGGGGREPLKYEGNEHPDLTHSRVRSVYLNDHFESRITTWKDLRTEVIRRALRLKPELGSRLSGVKPGTKTDQGFSSFPDIGFSIQAQDANDSWRSVVSVAREMGWTVRADFDWMNKPAAANPGASAELLVQQ